MQSYAVPGGHQSAWADYDFLFCDPAQPQIPLSATTKQFLFRDTDYAECLGNSDWVAAGHCYPNSGRSRFASVTGWTTADTRLTGAAGWWMYGTHALAPEYGHYQITTNANRLLSYDISGDTYGAVPVANRLFNTIELGGPYWASGGPATGSVQGYAQITRWAGENPHGDTEGSRYVYALLDLMPPGTTGSYVPAANASRVNRHIFDFKAGGSQYIVEMGDVATSSAEKIQAYFHYSLSGVNRYTEATISPAGRTATVTHTKAKLNSKFLPVAGPNTLALVVDSPNGAFPGGAGSSARATLCASTDGLSCANATSAEWIVVHQPSIDTSATLPAILQPTVTTTGGSATAVEIQDTLFPKVAVCARKGFLLSQLSLNTSHAGTAQYVVAGLAPGTYTITAPAASLSSCVAVIGANTCYFEAKAGAIQVQKR
jgi:hypothetical protein